VPDAAWDPEAEEQLGRAFDRRLAARLLEAARPHRGLITGSLLLFPVVAVLELAQPWLLKLVNASLTASTSPCWPFSTRSARSRAT